MMRKKEKIEPYKPNRGRRAQGENWYYFIIHNIISAIFFFLMAYSVGILDDSSEYLSDLITIRFFATILIVFGISILSGFLARIAGYYVLKLWYVYVPEMLNKRRENQRKIKEVRRFGELNTGINAMGYTFLISTILSSLLFSIGALSIVQTKIFGASTFFSLVITYLAIKLIVWFISKYFVEKKF